MGRAGRAIDRAVGVLLAGREDEDIQQYFRASASPAEEHVSAILEALAESDGLTARQIEEAMNLRAGQIEKVLKFLSIDSPAPVIKDGSEWRRTPLSYRMDHARIERLTQQRIVEWQEVQSYIDTQECLMTFLARALDDNGARSCGQCANCLGHPVVVVDYAHAGAVAAARYLKNAEFPLVCKKQVAAKAFKEYGFRGNLPERIQGEPGRILSRWATPAGGT